MVKVGSKITKNYVEKQETLRDYEINVLNLNDDNDSGAEINRQDFEREQMLEKMKILHGLKEVSTTNATLHLVDSNFTSFTGKEVGKLRKYLNKKWV